MVIEVQHLIYVKLIFSNLPSCPIFSSKSPESKLSVIKIDNGKNISCSILLDFLHLDVAIWLSSKFFLESLLISLQTVLFDIILPVRLLSDCDRKLRIKGDHTVDQRILSGDLVAFRQLHKKVIIRLKSQVGLGVNVHTLINPWKNVLAKPLPFGKLGRILVHRIWVVKIFTVSAYPLNFFFGWCVLLSFKVNIVLINFPGFF